MALSWLPVPHSLSLRATGRGDSTSDRSLCPRRRGTRASQGPEPDRAIDALIPAARQRRIREPTAAERHRGATCAPSHQQCRFEARTCVVQRTQRIARENAQRDGWKPQVANRNRNRHDPASRERAIVGVTHDRRDCSQKSFNLGPQLEQDAPEGDERDWQYHPRDRVSEPSGPQLDIPSTGRPRTYCTGVGANHAYANVSASAGSCFAEVAPSTLRSKGVLRPLHRLRARHVPSPRPRAPRPRCSVRHEDQRFRCGRMLRSRRRLAICGFPRSCCRKRGTYGLSTLGSRRRHGRHATESYS